MANITSSQTGTVMGRGPQICPDGACEDRAADAAKVHRWRGHFCSFLNLPARQESGDKGKPQAETPGSLLVKCGCPGRHSVMFYPGACFGVCHFPWAPWDAPVSSSLSVSCPQGCSGKAMLQGWADLLG